MKKIKILSLLLIIGFFVWVSSLVAEQNFEHNHVHKGDEKHSDHDGHNHGKETEKHSDDDGHDHGKETEKHSDDDGHDHGKEPEKHSDDDGHDHGKETEKHSDDDGHDHSKKTETFLSQDGSIKLSSEQLEMIDLKKMVVKNGSLSSSIVLNGEFLIKNENVSKVTPHLLSYVTKVNNILGDKVKKDDVLAVLQSRDLAVMIAEYIASKAELELAISEYERQQKLMKSKVVSKREFLQTKRNYLNALAVIHKNEDVLSSLGIDFKNMAKHFSEKQNHEIKHFDCSKYLLKAPISGTIIKRDIAVGEAFADDNTKVVFTIANLEELYLDLQAGQQYLKNIKIGDKIKINVNGIGSTAGEVTFIGNVISPETRTAKVRVLVNNKAGKFKAGMFATGIINIHKKEIVDHVLVSQKAVQTINGEKVVFVQKKMAVL